MASQYIDLMENLVAARKKESTPGITLSVAFKEIFINGPILKFKYSFFILKKIKSKLMDKYGEKQ